MDYLPGGYESDYFDYTYNPVEIFEGRGGRRGRFNRGLGETPWEITSDEKAKKFIDGAIKHKLGGSDGYKYVKKYIKKDD